MSVRYKVPVVARTQPLGLRLGRRATLRLRDSRSRGFTLLELAVIIFIIGLMVTIVLPYFGGLKDEQLRSSARQLAGKATYLFEQASAQKVVIRLVFDLNHNTYHVLVLDPYSAQPTFMPDRSPGDGPVHLPPDVHFRNVTVEGVGSYDHGAVACQFYPEGYVDATLIHLADTSGDVMTLGFDPLTGRVRIANGDLSQRQLYLQ